MIATDIEDIEGEIWSRPDFSVWEIAELQRADDPRTQILILVLLNCIDPDIRFLGIRWIAEAGLKAKAESLEKLLETEANNSRNFGAILLALDRISGRNNENTGEYFAAKFLIGSSKSVPAKIMALRMVSPNHPDLTVKFLIELTKHEDKTLQREAVRTLRLRGGDDAVLRLREIVADETADERLRCEALLGLQSNADQGTQLKYALQTANSQLQAESQRMLVGTSTAKQAKVRNALEGNNSEFKDFVLAMENRNSPAPAAKDEAAWKKRSEGLGDPVVGERIFFHPKIASCSNCHEYKGRGGRVGPDLTTIAKSMTRERLLQSIVDPSREIAPQFTPWIIQATDGTTKTGVYVGEEVDGTVRYADNEGKIFKLHPRDVEDKKTSEKSIMPEGLPATLTAQELRDLLAFLLQQN